MREPEKNPESFILHEDDEWFATLQTPAEHSEELSDDQATGDETVDETINDSADLSVRKHRERENIKTFLS